MGLKCVEHENKSNNFNKYEFQEMEKSNTSLYIGLCKEYEFLSCLPAANMRTQ
jgi:hypothetical protein